MAARRASIWFIMLTVMLDAMGIGLLIPVSPRLIQELGGNLSEADAAAKVGTFGALFAVGAFLFSSFMGVLSDRFGRRPVLLVALLGSGIDYFASAFAPTLAWLYITRFISGASGASVTVASAYLADVTPPEKRGASFGMMMASFGLGFIFGPLIGGVVGDPHHTLPVLDWFGIEMTGNIRYPFYVAGALTMLNCMYGLFVVPESLPRERRAPLRWGRANPIGAFNALLKYPLVTELALSLFFLSLAQFLLHVTWVLYTGYRYGWTERNVGYSLFAVGVATFFVQGVVAGRIIAKVGERRTLMTGVCISVLAYLGYGTVTEGWMIFLIISYACFAGISQPAIQAMITKTVRPDEQGATQGAITALNSVAAIIGPPLGGTIFKYAITNYETPQKWEAGAPYYTSALLAGVGACIAWYAVRHGRHLAHGQNSVVANGGDAGPGGGRA
ncbi:MAG TPA: TCR/Tet family MFS transporter [Phycisphaerales bacterium]|nr:TCR/Tet family MFS transporter [Phycisphaerales bacterium]